MGLKMSNSSNPLAQYFRQPAIYLRLPSQGSFYPKDTLELTPTGELPVYPMTALDEITYRTPDALFNGQAVVNVIQSCVPNIKNAWNMPAVDLNAVLTAIRIASYGSDLGIQSQCPACSEENEYETDLRVLLDNIKPNDFSSPLTFGDLTVVFKPMSYEESNRSSSMLFEQQKTVQGIYNSDLEEDKKLEAMNNTMSRMTELTMEALKHNIAVIQTPIATVAETEFVDEFLRNCDRETFNAIREHIIKLRESSEIPPMSIKCAACEHQYEQQLTLDQTSFFVKAS